MKIAFILNSFPEISEKFLLNHIIGLIEAGYEVDLYPAHRPRTEKRHDIYDRYQVGDHVRYVDVPRSFIARGLLAPIKFARLFLHSPKMALDALNTRDYRSVAKNLKLLFFGNALVGKRYDIIHCHFGVNGLIGAYLKRAGCCSALVTAFHGSDINSYPRRHGTDVYRIVYAESDAITSNTNFTKGKIVANGCPPEKIVISPEPLIASEYADLKREEERHSLLTVGRLEEKKGHRYALEAVAKLSAEFPDLHYYVAGGGSLEAELKAQAEALGISTRVKFLGLLTGSEVKKLYGRCSVFTLPSVTASNGDMEGQGLVIQEAQICGAPVVTTQHNGIPDGLIDGETGFLVPEKDVEALADRIARLFRDDETRTRMGARGVAFVRGKYDIGVVTRELGKVYDEILE